MVVCDGRDIVFRIAVFACTAERLLLVREGPGGSGLRRAVTSPWDWNLTLVQFDRDLSKRAFCCDLCSHSNLFPQRGKLYVIMSTKRGAP
jgi:hypothetical protein